MPKSPTKDTYILQKRHMFVRSLLIAATPYIGFFGHPCKNPYTHQTGTDTDTDIGDDTHTTQTQTHVNRQSHTDTHRRARACTHIHRHTDTRTRTHTHLHDTHTHAHTHRCTPQYLAIDSLRCRLLIVVSFAHEQKLADECETKLQLSCS